MNTDRELLEMAAKAAGLKNHRHSACGMREERVHSVTHCGFTGPDWNPLTDDGDAFRLLVRLGISLESDARIEMDGDGDYESGVEAWKVTNEITAIKAKEVFGRDACATTRRAVVRVAAAIGEQMP